MNARTHRTRMAACFALCMLLPVASCSGPATSEQWQQDLRTLERELEERHVDLYHTVSEQEFKAAVNDLHDRIPNLTEPEILVGIAQVVAMVGDGHTSFFPGNQKNRFFGFYPLNLWAFSDGIYLTVASAETRHLFGKRLVQIDDTPIEEAWRRVSTTIGADNDMEYQYTVPFELIRPELLHALGIAHSAERATYVFEDGTRQELEALDLDNWRAQEKYSVNPLFGPEGKVPTTRLEALFCTELMLPHLMERKWYWYTWLEEHRTVFLQYNTCWNQKNRQTFAEVVEEMMAFAEENEAERLVIDMRNNTGGEPAIGEPLVQALEKSSRFSENDGVYVLVGRRTFSAALTNAAWLRARAGAQVVGEAPRGKPNNPSEGRDIDLPKTGIWATVSTQFVERDQALGEMDYLPIDIPVGLSYKAYISGLDVALETVLGVSRSAEGGPVKNP